jgi:twitching motility protein PilT
MITQSGLGDYLLDAANMGASDLHITAGLPPMVRISGKVEPLDYPPLTANATRDLIYDLLSNDQRQRLENEWELDFSYALPRSARFRVNVYFQRGAIGAAFRTIPSEIKSISELGLPKAVEGLTEKPRGLVLVTGPTGSGKSTTLAAMIDKINETRHEHIMSVEDPIEFLHEHKQCIVNQREVNQDTKSFAQALKHVLRQDPDVILVGEMRDLETIALAITAAETGHLVFGTLHTTTAAGTIDRIIDQFPADRQSQIRVMLAESLKGVISQTLCKKIGGGRVAAREVLLSITAVTNLIREGKTFQIPTVMQTSKRLGMVTLNDALLELVDGGLIEPSEGYIKAVDKSLFLGALKARGLDTAFAEIEAAPKDAAKKEPPKSTTGQMPAAKR